MSEAVSEGEPAASDSVVRELTAFQQNILVVLAEEPRYGLAIKRTLEDYYGTEVNHGRLYPNLDDLVEMDLVEKSELDKRTNQYELTEPGRDALLERLDWVLGKYVTDENHAADVQELVEKYV
jgi:DNA-binding PadR family transcriptional regulator